MWYISFGGKINIISYRMYRQGNLHFSWPLELQAYAVSIDIEY